MKKILGILVMLLFAAQAVVCTMQYASSGDQFYLVYTAGSTFTILVVYSILFTKRKQS
jgi:hypothetical protein